MARENAESVMSEAQKAQLEKLMELPEDMRGKLIYIAVGMMLGTHVEARGT